MIAPAGQSWEFLRPFAGPHSILLLDGEEHLRERRLMAAPFHGERMRALAPLVAELARREFATWQGRVVALERMRQLTLEIILRVVFGASDEEAAQLRDAIESTLAGVRSMPRMLSMALVQRDLGPRSPWGRFRIAVERFDALLLDLLARRRSASPDGSVLATLLEQRDHDGNPPTDRQLRDQLVALLVGGHDSSAATLAWAFERLARHPAVLARLREDDPAYLDAVVKEVMRVRPALTIAPRLLLDPVADRRPHLPAGVQVAACLWLAMRREDLWPRRVRVCTRAMARGRRGAEPGVVDPVRRRRAALRRGAVRRDADPRDAARGGAAAGSRPAAPESERARRSMLVVVPDRGGELIVG